jgi:hypothetical protein
MEKIREGKSEIADKYMEWFNEDKLLHGRKFKENEDNNEGDIDQDDNTDLGWNEYHYRKIDCLAGDCVGKFALLDEISQGIVQRFINSIYNTMRTNNFNDALFMDFLTIEDKFSQLSKEKLKQ